MSTLPHPHPLIESAPILDLSTREQFAPLLSYDSTPAPEAAMWKTLSGFAIGSLLMGLMLNAGALLVLTRLRHMTDPASEFEFLVRGTFLAGLTFVGTSLLLVSLKAREDRSPVPLHSKHWLVSLATGAFFALAVFGPGLVAERGVSLNSPSAIAAWMGVLLVPIAASFWLVTRRRTRDVLAEMIGVQN